MTLRPPMRTARTRREGHSTIALIQVLLLFEASLYSAVTPVLPHYAKTLGASKPAVGLLAAAYSAGVLPGSLIGGWLAARAGVRRTTLIGLLAFAVSGAAFGFAGTLVTLDLLRVVQGIACGCIWGGALTWAIAVAPRASRGAMLGSVIGAATFGTLLGPLVGVLAVSVGTAPVFTGVGLVSLALAVRVARHPDPTRSADESSAEEPGGQRLLSGALRSPGMRLGAWLVLVEALIIGATSALLPLRLAHQGASGPVIGATFLLASALSAALSTYVGRMTDRRGPARPMSLGLIAGAGLAAVVALPGSWPLTAALTVLMLGIPLTGMMIPAVTLMTDAAERGGLAIVLTTTLVNLGYAIGETVGAPSAASVSSATSDVVPMLALSVLMLGTLAWVRTHARAGQTPSTRASATSRATSPA